MANKNTKPGRPLITLAVFTILGIVALLVGHLTQGAQLTPKLALDLEGGTQLILTPKLQEGSEARAVTAEDMQEAISIIRQRVDASGVAEAEISTLGADNIVVAIPGETDEEILNLVRSSATMRFRPVLQAGAPEAIDASQLAQSGAEAEELAALSTLELAERLADTNGDGIISDEVTTEPTDNSDPANITEADVRDFFALDCTDPANLTSDRIDDPAKTLVACAVEGDAKYLLGPADIEGTNLLRATAGPSLSPTGTPTGQYGVSLELDAEGAKQFAESSQRLYDLRETDPTRNRFAVVLDGNVIVAPGMNSPIFDGRAEITGSFGAAGAQALANQLQFGSLPLNFEVQSEQQISATLGSNQLEKGLWAGLIGLLLVLLYMMWQYRGLVILSAGSLVIAAGLTYLIITILSWTMGYRLSLPGVAGLIVAVGITADSFIVYFERIRDEIRNGRPLEVAVEDGWSLAKRTILISDAVNLVAATVLYVLAVGGVQGFAFTLGVTTVVDLVVVFMFTHPMLSLLTRTKFFGGGHRLSGLDPLHLGAEKKFVYQGRGRVKQVSREPSKKAPTREPALARSASISPQTSSPMVDANGEERLSLAQRRRLAALETEAASADVANADEAGEKQVSKEDDRG